MTSPIATNANKYISLLTLATSFLASLTDAAFTATPLVQQQISSRSSHESLRKWSTITTQSTNFSPFSISSNSRLFSFGSNDGEEDDDEEIKELEEETRLKILKSRRNNIRSTLKSAESLRNFRINKGLVPEIDEETGKPIKSDSKVALTFTAFIVAAGAVTLRVGGRAALVSAVGLDFANENPELKENMDQFLSYAGSLDPGVEGLMFLLAWTFVKVFCFDFGGIILALSSGILFGGVLQGAFFSAAAATFGSSVAFLLAKLDTPVRSKALEVVEEYPSLRGIEKVVAEDGLKAILTLRLAPILPIPIGMYNYVYGVTNVPFLDFAGGVFLGSFKPYLLDSYLGYFGKQVVDGTAGEVGGLQDIILLVALGVSVMIGVFASQLAGETWDSVKEEVEAEQRAKKEKDAEEGVEENDGITRSIFGVDLPQWLVGMQLGLQDAEERMEEMICVEYKAAVWNSTAEEPPGQDVDPAFFIDSPEILGVGSGFDVAANICDGLVLSPSLIKAYFKYADPLYDASTEDALVAEEQARKGFNSQKDDFESNQISNKNKISSEALHDKPEVNTIVSPIELASNKNQLLEILAVLSSKTQKKLRFLEEELDKL